MNIEVHAIGFSLTDALRKHSQDFFSAALLHHAEKIKCVVVRLSDANGPKGGQDKICHVQCVIPGSPDVILQASDSDLYAAIHQAAQRIGRTVSRTIKKRQSKLLKRQSPVIDEERLTGT